MRKLHISRGFSLPIDLVTQRTSILGKTRSGKSYTAGVVVEEVLKAHQQTVILDPKGDWWGLRSSADGRVAGLPITIMGGKHGDIPLEPSAGALVADIIVNEGISVVLDLSLFESKADEIRFATAFLDRLYRKNTKPLLLVIDEADTFAPQHPEKNETVMLNRMETICRRGAGRGIGIILISQRSAALHKGCLSQTELMIAHQTNAPQDKDAIKLWVVSHGDEERRKLFMARISELKKGMAIVWSPSWLEIYQEIVVRMKETYDSSDAPKVGQRRRAPRVLAKVDLERLKRHMAETIEKAKQEDPKLLHAEIARLKNELGAVKRTAMQPAKVKVELPKPEIRIDTKTVEVPAVQGDEVKKINAVLVRMEKLAGRFGPLLELEGSLRAEVKRLGSELGQAVEASEKLRKIPPVRPVPVKPAPVKLVPVARRVQHAAVADTGNGEDEGNTLSKSRMNILRGLLEFESIGIQPTRYQLAGWLGLVCSGSFKNNLYGLRAAGLIEFDGEKVFLTDEGRKTAPAVEGEITTEGVLQHCMGALTGSQSSILKHVHGIYPEWIGREELAEALGIVASGSYKNNLYKVHAAEMIEFGTGENKGAVRCSGWMFIDEMAVR